jgi:hypothetical protein
VLLIAFMAIVFVWASVIAVVVAVCVSAARGDRTALPRHARRPRAFRLVA